MRVTLEIEAPLAAGKTRLAEAIFDNLRSEYEVTFLGTRRENLPRVKEIFYYEINPL